MPTISDNPFLDLLVAVNDKINMHGYRAFATVVDALTGMKPSQRFDGKPAWITSEQCLYRFIGGTADSNFVPDDPGGFWNVT